MSIESKRELEVTRKKLRGLEELYEKTRTAADGNDYAQQLTLRSLRRNINQLKEEIARFEARDNAAACEG
jgi:replicative DNA helicase